MDVTSDDKQTAVHLYNKIRENINQFIKKNHYTAIFTISGGILPFYNLLESEYDEMMKRTDFSLNTAKKRGRNRYYIFNEQDYQRFLHLKDISDVLHAAVIHDFRGFSVALQPLVKAGCRQPFWCGNLDAFFSGQFGTISPAEFIHFGTTRELLNLLTEEISDYEYLDWKPLVFTNRTENEKVFQSLPIMR